VKAIFFYLLVLQASACIGQNVLEWDGVYQLQLSDFQSKETQIGNTNVYSLNANVGIGFSFYMSNYEFMFTKNFNSKVSNTFTRAPSTLIAPDLDIADDLVNFARYEFDLCELYARRFRRDIFENKGTFSAINFLQPLYDSQQRQMNERLSSAMKATDLGRNKAVLNVLHDQVLKEIQELTDYCKTCKPPKKKK
jgi:hypothetical protein